MVSELQLAGGWRASRMLLRRTDNREGLFCLAVFRFAAVSAKRRSDQPSLPT